MPAAWRTKWRRRDPLAACPRLTFLPVISGDRECTYFCENLAVRRALADPAGGENDRCARRAGSLVVHAAVPRARDRKNARTPIPIARR